MSSLRRFAGARQKVGATVAAIVLGVGVAVVAAPLAASAHTATVSGVAACTSSTGAAVVTWTLANDYDEVATVTDSTNKAIPVGTTIAATGGGADTTKTFTETIAAPAAGKSVTAAVGFSWGPNDTFVQPAPQTPVTVTVGKDCTPPTPECVTVLWNIPGGDSTGGHQFDKPQTIVDHKVAACGDLTVVTPPTQCGAYQVDSYINDDGTKGLIAGGVLKGPGNPYENLETLVSPQYKYIQYGTVCTPPTKADATATVTTTPPTCSTDGTVDFTDGLVNAHWADTTDTTDGHRIAIADTGHTFADGSTQKTVDYTYPAKLTGAQCFPKDATASVTVATAATCTTAGTVDFSTGLVNATWLDATDTTDGTRTAVATAGHLFANGTDREDVSYTIPAQLTNCDATASFTTTPASCTAPGTVGFTITNATWDDPADVTDGSRTATAVTGHTFADGTSTATVVYSIPSQLTTNCAVLPPVTPPTVTPPVVSPPTVNPPTVTTTVTKVDTPTVTPQTTTTTKKVSSPTVLASTGINDSTPIAGSIALVALLFGGTIVIFSMRRRRKATGE